MHTVKGNGVAMHMRGAYASAMVKRAAPQQESRTSPETLTGWLKATMAARDMVQDDLIRLSGLPQPTVNKLVNGVMSISTETLPALERALGTQAPAHLARQAVKGRKRGYTDHKIMATALASPITGAAPRLADHDVQVWIAMPVGRGPLFLLQTAATEFAWRPPSLSGARQAFMMRMPDDSMSPWREAGEPIYFDPDADPAQARHAMLQLDIGLPADVCLVCRLLSPAVIGEKPHGMIYRDGRKSSIPDGPVRRVIPALEWTQIIPP